MTDKQNNPLTVLIAPDSFKGSLSSSRAALAIEQGLRRGIGLYRELRCIRVPIADGGEGTLEAIVPPEDRIEVAVTGIDGAPVHACYGCIDQKLGQPGCTPATDRVAVIEMAVAAGLTLLPEAQRNVMKATTYGVGELILHALENGFRRILLTVGGSGTNDGGCGMLSALGAVFTDRNGKRFCPTGGTLSDIASLDPEGLDSRLSRCELTIATDVKNTLIGENGATVVYSRQKGADDAAVAVMERGMKHLSSILTDLSGKDIVRIHGCGAGGGLPAPLMAFTNARITSGIKAVLNTVNFGSLLQQADLVITGEGRIDRQSLCGKAISGVAQAAAEYGCPTYALVGCIGDSKKELLAMGLTDILAISDLAPSLSYSMTHAEQLLEEIAATLRF